ncbi:MAG: Spy0128 family protein [Lachnospiraceae bacterium]
MKKMKVKMLSMLLVVGLCLPLLPSPVHADETKTVSVIRTNAQTGVNSTSSLTVLNHLSEEVSIGEEKEFGTSISELISAILTGEAGVTKNAAFEDEEDARNGIVKTIFDVATKPVKQEIDVVLVLDVSASMSMWINDSAYSLYSGAGAASTMPCLHADHYYHIPEGTWGATGTGVYFKMSDEFGGAIPWYTISSSQWSAFETKYALSLPSEMKDPASDLFGSTQAMEKYKKIGAWKPQDHHYSFDGANYNSIPASPETGFYYSSPWSSVDGCYDRMMVLHESVSSMSSEIMSANTGNRIAVITFASTAGPGMFGTKDGTALDFTNSLTDVEAALPTASTLAITNYESGLNKAAEFLNARSDTSRKAFTIFVSDGEPNQGNAINGADNVKNNTNSKLYCVGLQAGGIGILQQMATDTDHYKDFNDVEEFKDYFKQALVQQITPTHGAVLTDVIADELEIICDADHPITVGEVAYTSLADLPSELLIVDGQRISWMCDSVTEAGGRLSFYSKLKESVMFGEQGSYLYDTNESANLRYNKIDGDTLETTVTELSIPSPQIRIELSSEEEDTGGLTVSKTVSGDGASTTKAFPFTVTLSDSTIAGTYGTMIFENGVATFQLKAGESAAATDLPAGVQYTVTESDNSGYTVTVNGTNATIAQGSITTDTVATASFNNDRPAEEVIVATPATVSLTAKKTLDGKAPSGSKFTFVLKDETGNVIQTKKNKDGSITFDELSFAAAGTYRFTITEKVGKDSAIAYDESSYLVKIIVTQSDDYSAVVSYQKDGKAYSGIPVFQNKTKAAATPTTTTVVTSASSIPDTKDGSNVWGWILLILSSLTGLLCIVIYRKSKKYSEI